MSLNVKQSDIEKITTSFPVEKDRDHEVMTVSVTMLNSCLRAVQSSKEDDPVSPVTWWGQESPATVY